MNRIKDIRKKRKFTQNELAFITGYTQSYISSIERGVRVPTYNAAIKISKALGVSITSLSLVDESELIEEKAKQILLKKKGGEQIVKH